MPKKTKTASQPDPVLADATRISPQQIWQAGLGAFLKAQDEGDRSFARLVSEGSELTARERSAHAPDDPDAPTSWHRLEQMFEDRVARALAAMDVPTHRDLEELRARVDELTRLLDAREPAVKKPAVKKPAVKKPAAKKPAVKKPVKKAVKQAAKKSTRA